MRPGRTRAVRRRPRVDHRRSGHPPATCLHRPRSVACSGRGPLGVPSSSGMAPRHRKSGSKPAPIARKAEPFIFRGRPCPVTEVATDVEPVSPAAAEVAGVLAVPVHSTQHARVPGLQEERTAPLPVCDHPGDDEMSAPATVKPSTPRLPRIVVDRMEPREVVPHTVRTLEDQPVRWILHHLTLPAAAVLEVRNARIGAGKLPACRVDGA